MNTFQLNDIVEYDGKMYRFYRYEPTDTNYVELSPLIVQDRIHPEEPCLCALARDVTVPGRNILSKNVGELMRQEHEIHTTLEMLKELTRLAIAQGRK